MRFTITLVICLAILNGCGPNSANQAPVIANAIHPRDELEILVDGLQGPGIITHWNRHVDDGGFVLLPWIGKVHLGGLTLKEVPHAIHRACRDNNVEGEGWIGVWRLEGPTAGDYGALLHAGDMLDINASGFQVPGEEEFLATIDFDGMVRIKDLGVFPAATMTERQLEMALNDAVAKQSPNATIMIRKLPQVGQ